jgi:hypothetical protein
MTREERILKETWYDNEFVICKFDDHVHEDYRKRLFTINGKKVGFVCVDKKLNSIVIKHFLRYSKDFPKHGGFDYLFNTKTAEELRTYFWIYNIRRPTENELKQIDTFLQKKYGGIKNFKLKQRSKEEEGNVK